MVDQTTINGRRAEPQAQPGVQGSLADLADDLFSLGELQVRLLLLDLRELGSRCRVPLALAAGGGALCLGAIPVLLLGMGRLLANTGLLQEAPAFVCVAIFTIVVGIALAWLGYKQIGAAGEVLTRSKLELSENLRWIRRALKNRNAIRT